MSKRAETNGLDLRRDVVFGRKESIVFLSSNVTDVMNLIEIVMHSCVERLDNGAKMPREE